MMLEVLNLPFVLLRGLQSLERAEIPPAPRLRIRLDGVQPVLARAELPDHCRTLSKENGDCAR